MRRQVWKLRQLIKRIARVKPYMDPEEAAAHGKSAADELARREADAAAAAEALLKVRTRLRHSDMAPTTHTTASCSDAQSSVMPQSTKHGRRLYHSLVIPMLTRAKVLTSEVESCSNCGKSHGVST